MSLLLLFSFVFQLEQNVYVVCTNKCVLLLHQVISLLQIQLDFLSFLFYVAIFWYSLIGMFHSNGSWRSIWSIEFKDELQMLELSGKLQVFAVLDLVHVRYADWFLCLYAIQTAVICLVHSIRT